MLSTENVMLVEIYRQFHSAPFERRLNEKLTYRMGGCDDDDVVEWYDSQKYVAHSSIVWIS